MTDDNEQPTLNLPSGDQFTALLRSVAELGRVVFAAVACSITRLDAAAGELVFEVVTGPGEDLLPGTRFPATAGIAGWVVESQQALVVEDVASDERFARHIAVESAYVPTEILAAPLIAGDDLIGVIQVLDRDLGIQGIDRLEMLDQLALTAAAALSVVQQIRGGTQPGSASLEARVSAPQAPVPNRSPEVARLERALDRLEPDRRGQAEGVIRSLTDLLSGS